MSISSLFLFLSVLIATASADSFASSVEVSHSSCPWNSPHEMFFYEGYEQPILQMSSNEVVEDLLCIKDLMGNYYAAQLYYPEVNMADRVQGLIQQAKPMPNVELAQSIFSTTDDILDLHFRIKLGKTIWVDKSESNNLLEVQPRLSTEVTHEIDGGYYFKPENLFGDRTPGQQVSLITCWKFSQGSRLKSPMRLMVGITSSLKTYLVIALQANKTMYESGHHLKAPPTGPGLLN